jgi:hypothetical protein
MTPAHGRAMQWLVVAMWVLAFSGLAILDLNRDNPSRNTHHTPTGCATGFITALAHGMWITLDCRILGRPVGAWRFAGFFCGPLGLWAYFLLVYRARALVMIPLSLLIYALPVGLFFLAQLMMTGLNLSY